MLAEVEVLALQVSHLIPLIDSVVRVVSMVHQALNTLILLALSAPVLRVCSRWFVYIHGELEGSMFRTL